MCDKEEIYEYYLEVLRNNGGDTFLTLVETANTFDILEEDVTSILEDVANGEYPEYIDTDSEP